MKTIFRNCRLVTVGILFLTVVSCKKTNNENDPYSNGYVSQVKIVSILPDKGGFDTEVVIYGSGFSESISENTVTINNVKCNVILADTNQLIIIMPKGCGSGSVTVAVKDIKATGPIFTYLLTPVTTTLVGSSMGYLDGQGTNALLNHPVLLLPISDGSIVFSDNGNGLIRNLEENGAVSTLQTKIYSGIAGMAVANNKLFVADINNNNGMFADGIQIEFWPFVDTRYYPISNFSTGNDGFLYGIGSYPSGNFGEVSSGLTRFNYTTHETTPYLKYTGIFDGYISVAGANDISDIQIDNDNDVLYFLDSDPQNRHLCIRKITNYSKSTAVVTTLYNLYSHWHGNQHTGDLTANPYINFYNVGSFYVENENKIYLVSSGVIRKIEGNIVSIVGGDYYTDSVDEILGYSDGKSTSSRFNGIIDIIQDANKNLIISDADNNRIRKIIFE